MSVIREENFSFPKIGMYLNIYLRKIEIFVAALCGVIDFSKQFSNFTAKENVEFVYNSLKKHPNVFIPHYLYRMGQLSKTPSNT